MELHVQKLKSSQHVPLLALHQVVGVVKQLYDASLLVLVEDFQSS